MSWKIDLGFRGERNVTIGFDNKNICNNFIV
jgi:hypothetical protein